MTSALTVTDADGRPIQTVGRRKEAIVRVRLLPGTGQFKLNGRTLEEYFPNKVHQQLIREPFVTLEVDSACSSNSPMSRRSTVRRKQRYGRCLVASMICPIIGSVTETTR